MVGVMMAKILSPEPGMEVYDPACGSAGLLIKMHLELVEKYGVQKNNQKVLPPDVAPLKVYGQEVLGNTFAMAKMNSFIHDIDANIALGDTMKKPAFTNDDGSLRQFDIVTANPMWNQKFSTDIYESDPYERFGRGIPPGSSADWGWIQHMVSSIEQNGRMAVVLDTGSVSRGTNSRTSDRERDIRKRFVEEDMIEAVILLPENHFYNVTGAGIVILINKKKLYPGEILLVNGSHHFTKGRPKNEMLIEHVLEICDVFREWKSVDGLSAVIDLTEIEKQDFNISPTRYVRKDDREDVLSLEEAKVQLDRAEEDREKIDQDFYEVLRKIGLNDD
jgi:type I restriction enzyme M protein